MSNAVDRDPQIVARGERLRQARLAAGYASVADAVRRHGFNQNSFYLHENGRATFSFKMAQERYAPAFAVNPQWLYSGVGNPNDGVTRASVPLVGCVQASALLRLYADGEGTMEYVDPPLNASPNTVGVRVEGGALGPVWDGAILYYDDVRSPVSADMDGKLCVVGLDDGRILVRMVRAAGDGTYHLLSNTTDAPLLHQKLVWAARVKAVHPG